MDEPTICVVEDRYGGIYSGGAWLAVAARDEEAAQEAIDSGPNGPDTAAVFFWAAPPELIAVGDTPEEAEAAIRSKLSDKCDSEKP